MCIYFALAYRNTDILRDKFDIYIYIFFFTKQRCKIYCTKYLALQPVYVLDMALDFYFYTFMQTNAHPTEFIIKIK